MDKEKIAGEEAQKEEIIAVDVEEEVKLPRGSFNKEAWKPRTSVGKKVKSGEITSIENILDQRLRIMEQEIVDALMPNLTTDLLFVGQSKGKFAAYYDPSAVLEVVSKL